MGCDIHSIAEVKFGDRWIGMGYIFDEPFHGYSISFFPYGEKTFEPFKERDYLLFSALAGVRNTHGVTPIDEPRGLPNNLSSLGERCFVNEDIGLFYPLVDLHSHSYVSGYELEQFDFRIYDHPNAKETYNDVANVVGTILDECKKYSQPEITSRQIRFVFAFDN